MYAKNSARAVTKRVARSGFGRARAGGEEWRVQGKDEGRMSSSRIWEWEGWRRAMKLV
jgi:hypothetical protein